MFRFFLVRLLLRLLSFFPLHVTHSIGSVLGKILNSFTNELSYITRKNIEICLPGLSQAEQADLISESLQESGKTALECGALWLWPMDRMLTLVNKVSGWELMENAMSAGKGVILAVPHIGSWEATGLYVSTRCKLTGLYRAQRSLVLDEMITKARERGGMKMVQTNSGGVRSLYKALGRGEVIWVMPDQEPSEDAGVFAPFFGIPANTMTLLSRLAKKTGAVILTGYAERLPKGRGYHIHISSSPDCLADKDSVVAATCLNNMIENYVRAVPTQYQWAYRRFKNQPEGGKRLYSKAPVLLNSESAEKTIK